MNNLYERNIKIEKLYTKDVKKIKEKYEDETLEKMLENIYRLYYVKNQWQISKKIDILFKKNKYYLKLYIL